VPLDPTQIEDQRFRIVFRGYEVEAVDAFLDEVEAELAQLLAEREARSGTPGPPTSEAAAPEPAAQSPTRDDDGAAARALRILSRAEQTAEEVVSDAAAEAEELRSRARAEAEALLSAARTECARLEAELEQRRQREVGALVLESKQLRAEIGRLSDLERHCVEGLQAWLSEQQNALLQHIPIADGAPPDAPTLRTDPLDPAA
jgi:DivIVA domain-containing protein